jgi:predicted metal-dependent phosphoesterase TrpH
MKIKLDLHVHTEHSRDSVNSIKVVNERCRALKLDGYAICDHNTLAGLNPTHYDEFDLVIVPGLEVTARGAHVLCLQPSNVIKPGLSISETVDAIHNQGGTAVLAHPLSLLKSWVNIKEVLNANLDAVEVANAAQWPFNYIRGRNESLASKLGLPVTGGSDSHIPETIGRSYTVVDTDSRDIEDILKAIKAGRTESFGMGISWHERGLKLYRVMQKRQRFSC